MEYLFLATAIIGELAGTTLLKYSDGFTKIIPTIGSILAFVVSFFFLSKSLQNINLSVAYATWSGVGIIITTLISIFILKEGISALGIVGIVLVVIGVILLNFFGAPSAH